MAEDGAGATAPRVDAHAHIFTRDMPFAAGAHSRPDYDYSVENYLADLRANGLSHGVIAAASLYGDYNDYTLQALRTAPNLRATVILTPETSAARLRDLAAVGVVGVRLVWRRLQQFPDLRSDPWAGFLQRLANARLHVELLAGAADLPALLPPFIESGVRVVVDHFGVPLREEGASGPGMDALFRAVAVGNCWVKISAGFRLPLANAQACTDRLLAEAGAERLLWGSDAPFINHEAEVDFPAALALYRRLVPDGHVRAAIDDTAMKLYFS